MLSKCDESDLKVLIATATALLEAKESKPF